MARKLQRNAFTLEDFLSQMQQLKNMGPIGGLLELIPGMGGAAKEAQQAVDRGDLKRVEAIIQSMTPAERRDPDDPDRAAASDAWRAARERSCRTSTGCSSSSPRCRR